MVSNESQAKQCIIEFTSQKHLTCFKVRAARISKVDGLTYAKSEGWQHSNRTLREVAR